MSPLTRFIRALWDALRPVETLPPPDRSTLREGQIINAQQLRIRQLDRQR